MTKRGPELDHLLTLTEAAAHLGCKIPRLREAIRRRELPAFIPGGRAPRASGPRGGYRIWRSDLERWYFNLLD